MREGRAVAVAYEYVVSMMLGIAGVLASLVGILASCRRERRSEVGRLEVDSTEEGPFEIVRGNPGRMGVERGDAKGGRMLFALLP